MTLYRCLSTISGRAFAANAQRHSNHLLSCPSRFDLRYGTASTQNREPQSQKVTSHVRSWTQNRTNEGEQFEIMQFRHDPPLLRMCWEARMQTLLWLQAIRQSAPHVLLANRVSGRTWIGAVVPKTRRLRNWICDTRWSIRRCDILHLKLRCLGAFSIIRYRCRTPRERSHTDEQTSLFAASKRWL